MSQMFYIDKKAPGKKHCHTFIDAQKYEDVKRSKKESTVYPIL